MKADNEPAISLPVLFKSVKKWKYVLRKKQKNKRTKKKEESPTWTFSVLSVAPRLLIVKAPVKLILNSLLMKICQSTLFEGGRAILMKN